MKHHANENDRGKRLDSFLHERMPEFSRSRLQEWIRNERVLIGTQPAKSSYTLRGGEDIDVDPGELTPLKAKAEDIPLTILYEDEDAVAIDKAAGMVVHAGAGVQDGTVVNALLHHFKTNLSTVGGDLRPGIVHRLDRFTSGVLLAAKTDTAHRELARQFAAREVEKIYLTLVEGKLDGEGVVRKPSSRDPRSRARMTARLTTGRPALTSWKALEALPGFTFLRILLGTGRTHQIRAHMASLNHPVAGDTLYGARRAEQARYFLHAHRLSFTSPGSGRRIIVESPLPVDLELWKHSLL